MMKNQAKEKRLCIVMGGHFSATIGGAQYQAMCIVDELVRTGYYDIYYLTRATDKHFKPKGYKILTMPSKAGGNRYKFIFDAIPLLKALGMIQPDIIYQRGIKADTAITAYYAKKNNRRMLFHVAHDHDVSPYKWTSAMGDIFKYGEKKICEYGLRRADYVLVQTEHQKKLLQMNYGNIPVRVIRNFHPLPAETVKKGGRIKIVWVANFKPTKQPELFVKLATELKHFKNVDFLMIGRGGDPLLYSELHKEISDNEHLYYLGEQPIFKVNELLAEADIFVNTSSSEGFPNTFIQAWMREVPVVSLNVDPDNTLEKKKIGFCVKTYENLVYRVNDLIMNDVKRIEIGRRAREYAFRYHSSNNVTKLIEILQRHQ